MSTKTAKPAPPDIGALGMLRWAWRQLTTMRTALILLLILALASIPGSLLPQRIQDPAQVTQYIEDNPRIGPFLDAVQLFDVYASVWFAAIYILLMVSLVGCVLPRSKQHYKAMRQAPPPAPRRLSRMPGYQAFTASGTAEDMLTAAEARLKKLGYRTTRRGDAVSAERGYLRETGNLLFHICLLGVTVTMAVGALIGYSGQRILVEGETFTNSLVAYDSFEPGSYFSADRLDDYRLRLNSFDASFDDTAAGNQFGQPRAFNADVTTIQHGQETDHSLRVNEPIRIDGSRVYLTGNGYAPVITVRDGDGNVTYSGPVVFLPQDGVYTSRGVVKVPDASPDQLGFVGILLPTASQNEKGELVSQFAELRNPYLVMNVFAGDLGLDAGIAQSVYELDTDNLDQLAGPDGQPLQLYLKPGETAELPDGLGSVELEEIKRYVALDVRHDPTQGIMLAFTIFLLAGLGLSLFVPRRRMWVRAADTDDGVATEVASLARGEDPRVVQAAESLAVELNNSPSRKA